MQDYNKCLDILKAYQGKNPYILTVQRDVLINNKRLTDFNIEYILNNFNRASIKVDKIVSVADWWAQKKKEEWNIDFLPEKLAISWYLGETDSVYHVFAQYRKSVAPVEMFISKKAVLTDFLTEDYHNIQVDFDRYDRLSMQKDPNRRIKDTQKEGVQFLLSRKKCILADSMGYGKMEPIDSLIPTPNGFVRMGDIKVGDKVFDRFGYPTTVLKTFYHKNKDIYKVSFSDGTSCECGLEHLWCVRDGNMRRRKQGWKTLSLKEMMDMGIHYSNGYNKFEIPVCEPVKYSQKEYLIDPYTLGILIGDGNMCNYGIHISIPDLEWETHERIAKTLIEGYELTVNRSASCPRHNIVKIHKNNKENIYHTEIVRLGLNVKGNQKFIPEEYKLGSVEQRIELLRGLMDSDGTISKSRNKISFSTTSQQLACDIIELVNSLGGTARLKCYDRSKENKSVEYYVNIQIKVNPFNLERKHERYNPTFKKYCTKYISNVEFSRKSDAQCLAVEADSHTYLTSRNYIVTHNTLQLSVAAVEGNFDCVLVICPASLKSTWLKELNYYVPERDITIIGGFQDFNKEDYERYLGYAVGKSGKKVDELKAEAKERGKWNENRYVIINFDILKDFYQLPTGRSENKKLEALQNSPLYHFINNKKALIIIDEAHKLSEQSADRYKIIKSLITNAKPDSVYLATGTPITNDPNNFYNLLSLINAPIAEDYDYFCNRYCEVMKVPVNKAQKERRDKIQASFLYNHGKKNWYELTQDEKKELAEKIDRAVITRKIIKGGKNLDELKMKTSHLYLRRVKEDLGILPNKFVHERVFDLNAIQLMEYNRLWEEYEAMKMEENPKKELSKELLEGAIYRRYLSNLMVEHTEELTDRCLAKGEKVVIACCYDEELYALKDYYGDRCVIYNGKISPKQKDEAVDKFMNDDSVMVFIGNIISAGVGLTLTKSRVVIFNNIDWVPGNSRQFEDRVYRIGQTRDCHIYYQFFRDTQYEKMWEKVLKKELLINQVIKKESEK